MTTNQPRSLHLRRYARLLRYALAYRSRWFVIVLTTFVGSAVTLLLPWPMQVLVDHALAGKVMPAWLSQLVNVMPYAQTPTGLIAWIALATIALFLVSSLLEITTTYLWTRVGQQMVYDLARDLFARVQRRSLRQHSSTNVGDAMARITTDSWCVYRLIDTLLLGPARAWVMTLAMLVIMARLNMTLTLIALAAVPVMVVVTFMLRRPVRSAGKADREIRSMIQSHVQQTLAGIHVVQAFAQEDRQHARFREFASLAVRAQMRNVLLRQVSSFWTGLVLSLATAAVVLLGARLVLDQAITLGILLVFLAYLASLQGQMRVLTESYMSLQSLRGEIDRVFEILDVESEVHDKPDARQFAPVRGDVTISHVTFGYEHDRPILNDVSLTVSAGQTIAIVGPTGAGKSTLVGLIPRFIDPWHGNVTIDGHDVRDWKLRELRRHISIVLQEPMLFPLSIAENIAFGRPDAPRDQIIAAAEAANAHDFISRLPDGYDTVIGERGATLSGGERQRLSIARALLKDAPVLIMDEPTSALDSRTESLLVEAVARLMRGRTTFIIAHRLSTIRRADLIVVLDAGRIVESGTHDSLLRAGGLYSRLHRAQTETTPAGAQP